MLETESLLGETWKDDETDGNIKPISKDTPSLRVKCIFIVLLCVVSFGDYSIEDNPAALQSYMLRDLSITRVSYAVFYSSTSCMHTLSGALSGFILDRLIGYRLGVTVFLFGIVSAQALFGFGAFIKSYWTMVAGRSLLGFCAPLVSISTEIIIVRWFKGGGMATMLAIRISSARVASVIQMNCMDMVYIKMSSFASGHECLGLTLFVSATVCLVSVFSAILVVIMDRRYIKSRDNYEVKTSPIAWINDIKRFDYMFWLIGLSLSVYYIGIFPFVAFGQIFYKTKYGIDIETADNLNSLIYFMAAITLPIFGFLSDKLGKHLFWLLGGTMLSVAGHYLLAFTFIDPYLATIMLGTGYSITTATVWPLAAYVTEEHNVGTAFAIISTGIGVLQTGMQYISGLLLDIDGDVDKPDGYDTLGVFFVITMILSFLCSCLLFILDYHRGGYLNNLKTVKPMQD